ncbi:hypothetical protein E4U16_002903 [Claviceps sp. LM84 group G4]|nr:hypothetical protein E4U16_002903 [Claviceps sp. LM84 group G4]
MALSVAFVNIERAAPSTPQDLIKPHHKPPSTVFTSALPMFGQKLSRQHHERDYADALDEVASNASAESSALSTLNEDFATPHQEKEDELDGNDPAHLPATGAHKQSLSSSSSRRHCVRHSQRALRCALYS